MASTVGRTSELARAREQLSGDPASGVLFLGPAGIGKSSVLGAAAELADSLGFEVHGTRAAPSEQDLPYVGLHDLISDVVDDVSVPLPVPLRRALDVVLLRADPPEGGVDVLAVDLAVYETLEELAARRRLALVLDDVQWLDQPTRRVLGFALRRLAPGRVVVLAAARESSPDIEALVSDEVLRLEVGPLTQAEIADLVERRTGRTLSPQQTDDLHRLCGGNPFLALELVRARRPEHARLERFPVPERHLRVLARRLKALSSPARRAVLAAALTARPTPALLATVAGPDGLGAAEDAGVLHVTGRSVEFDHPLLAAAARQEAGVVTQREMHLALAAASHDPLDRARHLALGTVGEDARLADELEAAAHTAAERGATWVAAQLSRDSLDHTPLGSLAERVRRAVASARWFRQCGENDEARAVLTPLLEVVPAGPLRARCLVGLVDAVGQDISGGLRLLDEALAQPGLPLDILLEARLERASALFVGGELEAARDEAARAGATAREARLDGLAKVTALLEASADLLLGVPLEQSEAWRRTTPWPPGVPVYDHPDRLLGYAAMGEDDLQRARAIFEELVRLARDRGDIGSDAALSLHVAEVAVRDGRLRDASDWAERSWRILHEHPGLYVRALVAAWTGELELARELAGQGLSRAEAAGDALFEGQCLLVLGFVEVSANRLLRASEYELRLVGLMARMGWAYPGLPRWQGDAVEALLGAGRVRDAVELTDRLWSQASHLNLRGCEALAGHCDGLIQAHTGDLKVGEDRLRRAQSLMDGLDMPLDRARTQLALGVVLRRRRQKAAARDALTKAHAAFVRAGARVWAERAEQELQRTAAGRAGEELTGGEQRVAELAAGGRTNREIAAQLYLSTKTVESVLTHVYRKVGVRSRTELARALADAGSRHEPSPG